MSSSDPRISVLTTAKAKCFFAEASILPENKLLNLAVREFGEAAKYVLEQWHLRQKAMSKTPTLAELGWLFSSKSYEQCTAESVAQFKAGLMAAEFFTDLTAGAGVDAFFIAKVSQRLQLVEADPAHAALLRHNFAPQAGVQVWEGKAEEVVEQLPRGGSVYLDPDRRPGGQRVFDFSGSTPDLAVLLPKLYARYEHIWIKASPMADVTACLSQLQGVKTVYAITWQDELKEMLFELEVGFEGEPRLEAVLLGKNGQLLDRFSARADQRQQKPAPIQAVPGMYLLEPHAGLTKLRLDQWHAVQQGLKAFNAQAAYFLLPYWLEGYPGRQFLIQAVLPYKPKQLQAYFAAQGIKRVQMAKRDFFLEVAAIRKVLKMPDGDDARLFFTKDHEGTGICVVCHPQKY